MRNGRELLRSVVIRLALKLQGANEVMYLAKCQPSVDHGEQFFRVADDVAAEPVNGTYMAGVNGKGAAFAKGDVRVSGDMRCWFCLIYAENTGTAMSQYPTPSPWAAT